jgi:hypothetical protein
MNVLLSPAKTGPPAKNLEQIEPYLQVNLSAIVSSILVILAPSVTNVKLARGVMSTGNADPVNSLKSITSRLIRRFALTRSVMKASGLRRIRGLRSVETVRNVQSAKTQKLDQESALIQMNV